MSVSETAKASMVLRESESDAYRVVGGSAVQEGLQHSLRDRGRNSASEAVCLLLQHDGHRVLGIVGRGEAHEPGGVDAVDAGLRRPRLTGDLYAGDLGGRTG